MTATIGVRSARLVVLGLVAFALRAEAQATATADAPALTGLIAQHPSELVPVLERYRNDRGALERRYGVGYSAERRNRFRGFYSSWLGQLAVLDFSALSEDGKIDYLLFNNHLRHQLARLSQEEGRARQMTMAPFADQLRGLEEARVRMDSMNAPAVARMLADVTRQIDSLRKALSAPAPARDTTRATRIVAFRTVGMLNDLKETLGRWYRFYSGYDPLFTWWVEAPYGKLSEGLAQYSKALRENVVGVKEGEDDPIIGDPIGADALKAELAAEMISSSPEELVAIAEKEFAWCETELRKAAREMGFGDDWRAALEKVKGMYVEPGQQPALIHQLALEAIEFVESRNLVTIPPMAREIWRMEMLSPEDQKVSPFFLGGEVIQVAYPTGAMGEDDKMMTLRGNNRYFARATVMHELIPGHHLQGYMTDRYQTQRQDFSTPFWTEGWALYWEMLLWDQGFARTPEERIGMLFWRSHRAARIIFSLRFHLGTMTPQEAIDFLVNRVGHERANATAEVRRSFNGSYPPLYQLAYMIGGLQFRALHRELVDSGQMTDRDFHDAILQSGNMPVEMVRARLRQLPLTRDYQASWRFYPGLR
ncbi:MAG: DUF885 family protein [Gemmatimonadota bacterium]